MAYCRIACGLVVGDVMGSRELVQLVCIPALPCSNASNAPAGSGHGQTLGLGRDDAGGAVGGGVLARGVWRFSNSTVANRVVRLRLEAAAIGGRIRGFVSDAWVGGDLEANRHMCRDPGVGMSPPSAM